LNQKFFFKKNKTEPKPVLVRFSFFGQKLVQTDLDQFCWFDSIFFGLGSVRIGFFSFRLIKRKANRTGRFFQNFNRFFFTVWFFQLFFFNFLDLIGFLIFLPPSILKAIKIHNIFSPIWLLLLLLLLLLFCFLLQPFSNSSVTFIFVTRFGGLPHLTLRSTI